MPETVLATAEIMDPDLSVKTDKTFTARELSGAEIDTIIYGNAPKWKKRQADKYFNILNSCDGLKGKELLAWVLSWNLSHPATKTSYGRILYMRNRFLTEGANGLLSKYGNRAGASDVDDVYFEEFKKLWLKEGAPSLRSCWLRVLGMAKQLDDAVEVSTFPSPAAFERRMNREIPEQAQYMARFGPSVWNRKYGSYINRNYDNIQAGQCWVADHAQIDVCVSLPNGKFCFPWVSAFVDFKTTKWLGWLVHPEAPNSDHTFQAFYYSALKYGLCKDIYLDNGKDFRCRDFAGGRKHIRIPVEETQTTSMLGHLGIVPHFALPYNAQSKVVERTFLKNKDLFSKHMPGYRGGNVVERPEKLDAEIKSGVVMPMEKFIPLFDDFIVNCLNKNSSRGKNLLGKSPDQLWAEEFTTKRTVSKEALKLFCMRSSGVLTIGRNGVHDGDLGQTYWAEWMSGQKGQKVYIRRDIKDYAEGWVFNAHNDEFIGTARMAIFCAPALVETEVERQELKYAIAAKRHDTKIAKAYAKQDIAVDPFEQLRNLKAGIAAASGESPEAAPKIHTMPDTRMDRVIEEKKRKDKIGTMDISALIPEHQTSNGFFQNETDRDLYQQRRGIIAKSA